MREHRCWKNTRLSKENRWDKSATPAQTCRIKHKSKVTQQRQANRGVFGLELAHTRLVGTVGKLHNAAGK